MINPMKIDYFTNENQSLYQWKSIIIPMLINDYTYWIIISMKINYYTNENQSLYQWKLMIIPMKINDYTNEN